MARAAAASSYHPSRPSSRAAAPLGGPARPPSKSDAAPAWHATGAQSACARAPRREPRGVAPHANATFIPLRRADSLGESTLCED
jgi:hypothetical protein